MSDKLECTYMCRERGWVCIGPGEEGGGRGGRGRVGRRDV